MAATQEALYQKRRRRSRPFLVGGAASRAGADEARPPAAPVPGQVHPAARRGAARPLRAGGRAGARPVRRLRHDARPGARVGLRRVRRRHRRFQRAADARQDAALQSRRASARPALGARRGRGVRAAGRYPGAPPRTCATGTRPRPPRSCFTSARSSSRSARRTSCASCSPGPRGRPDGPPTSTSTSRARRSAASTGATSTAASAGPVESARRFLLRYTLDTLDRIETFAAVRRRTTASPRSCHGDARELAAPRPVRRRHHLPAVPGPDRLPRAAPLRLRAARPRRAPRPSSSAVPPRAPHAAALARIRRRASPPCFANARSSLDPEAPRLHRRQRPARPLSRDPPAGGLRLVERHERHVNRRTGRRAGEYYESILIAN